MNVKRVVSGAFMDPILTGWQSYKWNHLSLETISPPPHPCVAFLSVGIII